MPKKRVHLPSEKQLQAAIAGLGAAPGDYKVSVFDGEAAGGIGNGDSDLLQRSPKEILLRQFLSLSADLEQRDEVTEQMRGRAAKLLTRIDDRRACAATSFQRHHRGRMGRRFAATVEADRAATVLQCVYRMLQCRYLAKQMRRLRANKEMEGRCIAIQRAWRGALGRKAADKQRQRLWLLEEKRCAILVQRSWRQFNSVRSSAAVVLQSRWRGGTARRRAAAFRIDWQRRRETQGVALLQRCYRGHRGRREAARARSAVAAHRAAAATVLQDLCRRELTRIWFRQVCRIKQKNCTISAARRIQRGCRRRWAARWDAALIVQRAVVQWRRVRREKAAAALKVETAWRGYQCRLQQGKINCACRLWQRVWRGYRGRRHAAWHAELRSASRRLQRAWRTRLRRSHLAATQVQAAWRGWLGRQYVAELRLKRERRRLRIAKKAQQSEIFRRKALEALNVFDTVTQAHSASMTQPISRRRRSGSAESRYLAMAALETGAGTGEAILLRSAHDSRAVHKAATYSYCHTPDPSQTSSEHVHQYSHQKSQRLAEFLPDIKTGEIENSRRVAIGRQATTGLVQRSGTRERSTLHM